MENNSSGPYIPPPASTQSVVQPISMDSGRGNKNKMAIIIFVIIALLLVGVIFFLRRPSQNSQTSNVTPTQAQEEESEPTEAPEVDKDSVRIQVLNGTGTAGDAGKASTALIDAGYNEDNIETGNADEYETRSTTISYKAGFEDVADDIKTALEGDFDDVEVDEELDEDSDYDIVITTGGEVVEEDDPAPTNSTNPSSTPAVTATLTPSPTP